MTKLLLLTLSFLTCMQLQASAPADKATQADEKTEVNPKADTLQGVLDLLSSRRIATCPNHKLGPIPPLMARVSFKTLIDQEALEKHGNPANWGSYRAHLKLVQTNKESCHLCPPDVVTTALDILAKLSKINENKAKYCQTCESFSFE